MSSQSAGRRRSNIRQYSAEDQALNMISKEAEARLAAKRAARAEAREIRMKEMEKQHKSTEEKQDRIYELSNDHATAKMRQQVGGSRRGSTESNDSGADGRDIDFKAEVRDLEEKYKAAMMTSAQLDNEKQSLVYQVELLKDQLEEQDEGYTQLQREYKDKCREFELQKRDMKNMQNELNILKQQLALKDRLIQESGFVIMSNDKGDPVLEKQSSSLSAAVNENPLPSGDILVSPETKEFLEKAGDGTLGTPICSNPCTNQSVVSRPDSRHDKQTVLSASTDKTLSVKEGKEMHESDFNDVKSAEVEMSDNLKDLTDSGIVMASRGDSHDMDVDVSVIDCGTDIVVVDSVGGDNKGQSVNDDEMETNKDSVSPLNPNSHLLSVGKRHPSNLESDEGDEFYDAVSTPSLVVISSYSKDNSFDVSGGTEGSLADGPLPVFAFVDNSDSVKRTDDVTDVILTDVTTSESCTDFEKKLDCDAVENEKRKEKCRDEKKVENGNETNKVETSHNKAVTDMASMEHESQTGEDEKGEGDGNKGVSKEVLVTEKRLDLPTESRTMVDDNVVDEKRILCLSEDGVAERGSTACDRVDNKDDMEVGLNGKTVQDSCTLSGEEDKDDKEKYPSEGDGESKGQENVALLSGTNENEASGKTDVGVSEVKEQKKGKKKKKKKKKKKGLKESSCDEVVEGSDTAVSRGTLESSHGEIDVECLEGEAEGKEKSLVDEEKVESIGDDIKEEEENLVDKEMRGEKDEVSEEKEGACVTKEKDGEKKVRLNKEIDGEEKDMKCVIKEESKLTQEKIDSDTLCYSDDEKVIGNIENEEMKGMEESTLVEESNISDEQKEDDKKIQGFDDGLLSKSGVVGKCVLEEDDIPAGSRDVNLKLTLGNLDGDNIGEAIKADLVTESEDSIMKDVVYDKIDDKEKHEGMVDEKDDVKEYDGSNFEVVQEDQECPSVKSEGGAGGTSVLERSDVCDKMMTRSDCVNETTLNIIAPDSSNVTESDGVLKFEETSKQDQKLERGSSFGGLSEASDAALLEDYDLDDIIEGLDSDGDENGAAENNNEVSLSENNDETSVSNESQVDNDEGKYVRAIDQPLEDSSDRKEEDNIVPESVDSIDADKRDHTMLGACAAQPDEKIRNFTKEREALHKEIKSLKDELEDQRFEAKKGEYSANVPHINGPDMQLYEIQREASKQIHDYKFKLQKAEQDIATLEGMVTRLETQVKRYKGDAERAEGMEDELKQEKRKLQKEMREASTELDELRNQNKHLTTRLERIRQTRSALGLQ